MIQKIDQKKATHWGIASLRSVGVSIGAFGGSLALYDLVCRDTYRAHKFSVSFGSVGKGFPVSGSFTNNDYSYFTSSRPIAFPEFDGLRASMTSTSAGFYSWSSLTILDTNGVSRLGSVKWSSMGLSIPELFSAGDGHISMIFGNGRPVETPDWIMPDWSPPIEELVTDIKETATNGYVIVLRGDVLFDFDKADLNPNAQPVLDRAWDLVFHRPEFTRISVEGHTDNVGDPAYNQGLSERRADAVMKWLLNNFGDVERGKRKWGTVGYGLTQPVAPNATAKGRAKNRRVEIVLWRK